MVGVSAFRVAAAHTRRLNLAIRKIVIAFELIPAHGRVVGAASDRTLSLSFQTRVVLMEACAGYELYGITAHFQYPQRKFPLSFLSIVSANKCPMIIQNVYFNSMATTHLSSLEHCVDEVFRVKRIY